MIAEGLQQTKDKKMFWEDDGQDESSSDEEEKQKQIELRREAEMKRRREAAKAKEEEERRRNEEEYGMVKRRKYTVVPLVKSIADSVVLIGDDETRRKYEEVTEDVQWLIVGENCEFQEELQNIEDIPTLKKFLCERYTKLFGTGDQDANLELHEFIKSCWRTYLISIVRVTKMGQISREEQNENADIFEKAYFKAHEEFMKQTEHRFRNISDLFMQENKHDEEVDELCAEIMKSQLSDEMHLEGNGLDEYVDEIVNASMEMSDPTRTRDTSPVRVQDRLSDDAYQALLEGTKHLFVSEGSSRPGASAVTSESDNQVDQGVEAGDSEDDDDDDEEFDFMKAIEAEVTVTYERKVIPEPQPVQPIPAVQIMIKQEPPEPEFREEMKVDKRHHLGIKTEPENVEPADRRVVVKKNVRFVDFKDERNTMRIFCSPLHAFFTDGDEGTHIYMDFTLSNGMKTVKGLDPPLVMKRQPKGFRSYGRCKMEALSIVRSRESLGFDGKLFGDENHLFWFKRTDAKLGYAFQFGLADKYTEIELHELMIMDSMCLSSCLQKSFSRLVPSMTSKLHYGAFRRELRKFRPDFGRVFNEKMSYRSEEEIGMTREECEWKIERELKNPYQRRVSSVLIISDWRLVLIDQCCFSNAEIKFIPSHGGPIVFNALKQFFKALFSDQEIEVKNLIFAFGGHPNFDIDVIRRFLTYIYKLTKDREIQIHWFSSHWVLQKASDRISIKVGDKQLQQHYDAKKSNVMFNEKMKRFIGEMRAAGVQNLHYHVMCKNEDLDPNKPNTLNVLYTTFLDHVSKYCGVYPSGRYFAMKKKRDYDKYMEDDGLYPYK